MHSLTDSKKPFHPGQSTMYVLLPILILQIYYVSDQHRLHSVLNRAPCMHLTVNWDGLLHTQFGSTENPHLYIFFIFLFSTLPSRTVATSQFHPDTQPPLPLLLPWMATMHRPLQSHHTQALHVFPSSFHSSHSWLSRMAIKHTPCQCCLKQHVCCSLTSLSHHAQTIYLQLVPQDYIPI